MSADLFAEQTRLPIPDRYRLLGRLHGARIAQLGCPRSEVDLLLAPLRHRQIGGFVARDAGGRAITIVDKRTTANLGTQEVLMVPDASSVASVRDALVNGRGMWLSPRPIAVGKDLGEVARTVMRSRESWAGRFIFKEETDSDGSGLRPPQAGALHAVMAHWSVSSRPGTIVMTTGAGKTETMLGLLVGQSIEKLVVIVPTDALRSQVGDKFLRLGVLKQAGCLADGIEFPVVAMLRGIPKTVTEVDAIFDHANVIVTTMQIAGNASEECQARMSERATHLFVDEAHHIGARTWNAFRSHFASRRILQFTATPFRNDGRSIGGKFIYVYPLRKPQVDWENREIRLMQKGEHYRTIPMTMEIEAILRPLKGHHPMAVFTFVARRRAHNKAGEVIREKGKRYPVTYWGIQTARRRDWSAAGGVGFHDLRRTAAKRMDKAVGVEAAQKMLGHANVKTTRIYLRKDTDVEKLRAQMEARDRYVAGQRENAGSGESSRKIGRGKR